MITTDWAMTSDVEAEAFTLGAQLWESWRAAVGPGPCGYWPDGTGWEPCVKPGGHDGLCQHWTPQTSRWTWAPPFLPEATAAFREGLHAAVGASMVRAGHPATS